MTMPRLKIGKIKYLNCLPYYFGWEGERFDFTSGTPAQINQLMRDGEIDAAPVSSLEYLQRPGDYLLFPDLGIASREYVRSVTLFSKKKIEDLNNAKIAVTEESLTSVHLLDLILKGKYNIKAELVSMPSNPKKMLAENDAALLIGNDALLAQPRKWIYRYDLGQLWWQWQNLPFVFAVWVVRRNVDNEAAQDFYQTLKERFLYNSAHLSECIIKHCSIEEFDRLYPKIYGYLSGLQFEINEACWQGLKNFADLAEASGLCGKSASFGLCAFGTTTMKQPNCAESVIS